jgi:hypothetical protein
VRWGLAGDRQPFCAIWLKYDERGIYLLQFDWQGDVNK